MLKRKFVIPIVFATVVSVPALSFAATNGDDAPPAAGQMNSSHTPYFNQFYEQSDKVLEIYKEPELNLITPGLKNGKWMTTNADMMTYLQDIEKNSSFVTMKIIGQSTEGNDLPLLVFTTSESEEAEDFAKKPTVWLQGHVHGNEPAGGESLLVLADELANGDLGKEVLQKVNIVIVPRINPDGAHYFQRQNALRLDANRDHIKLDSPEIRALHKAMNEYKPEIIVDAHEYGVGDLTYKEIGDEGSLKYHDILLLSGKNLNIPNEIRKQSDELFSKNAFDALQAKGFSAREYFTDSYKDGVVTLTEGGAEARIGRNANGLQPSFSFLVESRGIGIGKENFVRRVASQVETHTSILKTAADNADKVKSMIEAARNDIIEKGKTVSENEKIILQSERTALSNQQLELVDIASGTIKAIPVMYNSSTNEVATLERVRPTAYILPPGYHHIVEKLELQGATVNKTTDAQVLEVESYVVIDKKVDTNYYEGHLLNHVTTEISKKEVFFPAGSYVISMAQPTANLVALSLEPESIDSYVMFGFIPMNVNNVVPVYRYMQELDLELE